MATHEQMCAAVQAYFDLFNAGDGAGLAALFSDDASITDPVGTEPKTGKADIAEFYQMATRSGTCLEQMGPVRIAANEAAFAFRVHVAGIEVGDKAIDVDLPTGAMIIDVIDVFTFNDAGKITNMRAYWGPDNISQ